MYIVLYNVCICMDCLFSNKPYLSNIYYLYIYHEEILKSTSIGKYVCSHHLYLYVKYLLPISNCFELFNCVNRIKFRLFIIQQMLIKSK